MSIEGTVWLRREEVNSMCKMRFFGCSFGVGILFIFVGLGTCLITSPIFGQDLSPTQQRLQDVKRELSKAAKETAELERLLDRAYEEKNEA